MNALVFDYDGLMVDSERILAECVIEIIAERGGTVSLADIGHLFGSTEADDEWERLLPTWCDPPIGLKEFEQLLTPIVRERVDGLSLLPGVADLIEAAGDAGWSLGLATGQSKERLVPNLARFGLLHRFDALVTAADVARGKPAPDIFLEVSRRLGVLPSKCVVLEDSLPGCKAALAAGMKVVVCPSLVSAHLEFSGEARRVASLAELKISELAALVS